MTEPDPLPSDLRAVIAKEAESHTMHGMYCAWRRDHAARCDCGVIDFGERIARLAWEARGRADWQPIASAPKMRTLLLFAVTDIGENGEVRNWKMATGSYSTGYDDARSKAEGWSPWAWPHQLKAYEVQPTHWMPLPPAPTSDEPAQEPTL